MITQFRRATSLRNLTNFVRGVTRPAITFGLVYSVIVLSMAGSAIPDALNNMTLVALSFWFADRAINGRKVD